MTDTTHEKIQRAAEALFSQMRAVDCVQSIGLCSLRAGMIHAEILGERYTLTLTKDATLAPAPVNPATVLAHYGEHRGECALRGGRSDECDCGFTAAMDAVTAQQASPATSGGGAAKKECPQCGNTFVESDAINCARCATPLRAVLVDGGAGGETKLQSFAKTLAIGWRTESRIASMHSDKLRAELFEMLAKDVEWAAKSLAERIAVSRPSAVTGKEGT